MRYQACWWWWGKRVWRGVGGGGGRVRPWEVDVVLDWTVNVDNEEGRSGVGGGGERFVRGNNDASLFGR